MSSLEQIVSQFPVQLKQAMYAAAELGSMRAGTWNGCAFNKAGDIEGKDVASVASAARAFNVSQSLVERFIRVWDSKRHIPDSGRTALLKRILTNVGISTPPDAYRQTESSDGPVVTVIDEVVYKGEQTKFIEALEKASTLEDFVKMGLNEEVLDEAKALVDLVSA